MKLWLVERTDTRAYSDEFDAFVVRAEDKIDAVSACNDEHFTVSNTRVAEISQGGEKGVILGSFTAG